MTKRNIFLGLIVTASYIHAMEKQNLSVTFPEEFPKETKTEVARRGLESLLNDFCKNLKQKQDELKSFNQIINQALAFIQAGANPDLQLACPSRAGYNAKLEIPYTESPCLRNTLLILATAYNKLETVKKLLQLGANPNIQNACGDSALHIVAKQAANSLGGDGWSANIPDIANLLVSSGADKSLKNNESKTAYDIIVDVFPFGGVTHRVPNASFINHMYYSLTTLLQPK
ncbi:MAG TPA: ankyrin repeat domain-containing protein [Candidatus Dependentiae bacterium]|nr:ankyrin repeat domain-containing protein [Candidatus Dependentiae bacterium]HRQ62640.1 ankyrin repeat domain-containing protein [Candidatus Dependentiae bacterium]